MSWRTERPGADEYIPYYGAYISKAPDGDVVTTLERQLGETLGVLKAIPETKGSHRYAPGKWSIKELVGHVADAERVFGFRALWFARAAPGEMPGFDENVWVPAAGADRRALADVVAEYEAVRKGSLALFRSLDDAAANRRGVANGKAVSVRALAWIIAGHDRHHLGVLRERYLG